MEISSFPTILSPEDIISQFYSPSAPTNTTISPSPLTSTPPYKRPRIHPQNDAVLDLNSTTTTFDDSTHTTIKDILASFLMFEDADNTPHQPWSFISSPEEQHQQLPHDDHVDVDVDVDADVIIPAQIEQKPGANSPSKKRSRATESEESAGQQPQQQRRLWVKDRSKDWWEKCSNPDFPEDEFKKAFRMSKATFEMLCQELDPIINKKDTTLRAAIPVKQRVAVCLWRLATGEPLRLVSKRFGLGISTCHKLVLEVCSAIKNTLMIRFLQWPDDARMCAIKEEFESLSGIPNVGGSIYTTHIPIIAPKVNVGNYFNKRHTERNQKTSYSVTIQGVVDPNGVFSDVCIGWPGSMPDEQVLDHSALSQRAKRGLLSNIWMVGNSGHPLTDWVLVPYTHQNLTWTQHAFNEKIGDIQKVARDAFARLKKRWGCLQKRTEVKLQELPVLLGACCVLHNICEMRKEEIDPETDASFELFDDEMNPEFPVLSQPAVQARDHIAHNLLHHRHGLAGNSFL